MMFVAVFQLNVKRAQKNLMMSSRSAWTDVRGATDGMAGKLIQRV